MINTTPNQPDTTTEPNKFQFASLGVRIAAAVIDFLLYFPFIILAVYNFISLKSFGLDLLINLIPLFYKPYMEWKYGATVGKMVVKLKVVGKDGTAITFDQAMTRFVPFFIYMAIVVMSNYHLFSAYGFMEAIDLEKITELQQKNRFAGASSFASFLLTFSILYVITNPYRQGLHDRLAKTYCIQLHRQKTTSKKEA